ncbi:MAG: hypothetical protein V4591_00620 [Bdellovibrionota bacterium]
MHVLHNNFSFPSVFGSKDHAIDQSLSSINSNKIKQNSYFICKDPNTEVAPTSTEGSNLLDNKTLNELFDSFSEFKKASNPLTTKQNKARFVRALAKIEKISVAKNNFSEIVFYIEKFSKEYSKKLDDDDKSVLIEYIKIKLDKQNIFNITFENRHRIERKDKFKDFLNSKLKDSTGAVLQGVFQLFFDFDITPPEYIFQFFDCFFKEGPQGPVFLNFLLENIFDEKKVFLIFKLMRAIQAAAKKEMNLELYESSFVGSFLKKIESEIIFRFYEEPEKGEEPSALKLKDRPLESLADEGITRIKAIFQKIESSSVDSRQLTSGLKGSTKNLWYNFFTDTSTATALATQNAPGISEGSFADNGTQDAILMSSFFYAAYAYGKWRNELGRAPTRESAFALEIENKLLNQILLKIQENPDKKQFSAESVQVLKSTLKQSGGMVEKLKAGPLLDSKKKTSTTNSQKDLFLPEATTELRLKSFLKLVRKKEISEDDLQACLQLLKNEFIRFHGGDERSKNKALKHYLITLNTLVFKYDKFHGTFYSHLMTKAKTQKEFELIKGLWPMPTEDCKCLAPNSKEVSKEGPHHHINDLIIYSKATYDGLDGVENYFKRVIQEDSVKWLDRVDAELAFHNLRLVITKNQNLTLEMKKNLLSRLNYYLELGESGPFAKLCVKRKNIHREVLLNFVASQGFAAKRHAQTIQSVFHTAKNLGSMAAHVGIGAFGWMWAACLVPVMDFSAMGNTRTLKNLKKSLQKELAWIDYKINNPTEAEADVKSESFEQIQKLISCVYDDKITPLSLNDIRNSLGILKEKKILTAILEDHHCKDNPLIWTIMDKLSKTERDQFLKSYYYDEEKIQKDIKKVFEKKVETKLSGTETDSYYAQVSPRNKFLAYMSSQLNTINDVADNALFVSFRVKAYLLSLKDSLGEDSDEYKLCQIEFKKFIRSSKEVSSPMRVIRKRPALSALWRKMLHRAIAAGSWGLVSNAFTASVGVLGGATLLGAKAAFLFSNPAGWAILGVAGLILLGACGARLFGYSVSDIWGYTRNTKHNRFMEKMLEDDLKDTIETDEKNLCKQKGQEAVINRATEFINDASVAPEEREKRLFFLFNEIELTIFNRESCLARLRDMLAIADQISDASQKASILCYLLKKVEAAEGAFRFLQQAKSIRELKDLSKSFLGGAAASLGSIASIILNSVSFGTLGYLAKEFIIAGGCVVMATVGDGISTYFNSGRFDKGGKGDKDLLKTYDFYEATGLIQTALAQCLRVNAEKIKEARAAAKKFKQQQEALHTDEMLEDNMVTTAEQDLWLKIDVFCKKRKDLMGKVRYLDEKEEESRRRSQVVPERKYFGNSSNFYSQRFDDLSAQLLP